MQRKINPAVSCFSILCCLLIIGNVLASETRLSSMGSTGPFTKDNSNVFLFPGSIYTYNNLIIAEMRTKNRANTFSAGVHLPMGTAVAGVYLNRPLNLPVPASLGSSVSITNATDLLLGFKVGENDLGIRFTLALENNDIAADTSLLGTTESASYFEFGGGVSSPRYDFGMYFGLPNIESTFGTNLQKWSGLGFGVSGRFFLGAENGPIQYVPVVVINQFTADLEQGQNDATTDFLSFRVGAGVHYTPDERNTIILGLEMFGVERDKVETPNAGESTVVQTNLPAFYLGGETRAKSWLLLRVGATHELKETRTTLRNANGDKTEQSRRETDFNVSVGVGIEMGRFLLDFDINDNFLFEGPDFISGQGNDSVSDFVNKLSVSYKF